MFFRFFSKLEIYFERKITSQFVIIQTLNAILRREKGKAIFNINPLKYVTRYNK
jgi:hypothetical protein